MKNRRSAAESRALATSRDGRRRARARVIPRAPEILEDRIFLAADVAISLSAQGGPTYTVGDAFNYAVVVTNTDDASLDSNSGVNLAVVIPQTLDSLAYSSPGSDWIYDPVNNADGTILYAYYTGPAVSGGAQFPTINVSGIFAAQTYPTFASQGYATDNTSSDWETDDDLQVPVNNTPAGSTLTVSAATGTYGGTTSLAATLIENGDNSPVPNELVDFHLGALDLGTATTDASGNAQVTNVDLAGLSAGIYSGDITASFAGDPDAMPNDGNAYDLGASSGSADINITPAPLTIVAYAQSKVYGEALPTLTASVAGFVNGDTTASLTTPLNLTTTATAASPVAGSPYIITASGAVDPNYTITYVNSTLNVTPAPLTIVASDQFKVYGAALPTLTASFAGLVNGDTPASLATLPTLTTTATAASHVTGSPYAITASGAVDPNYAISYVGGSLGITPAYLTVTADDQSKVYGAALPTLTASFAGFVNGDTTASLAAAPTLATTATAASHVAIGGYAITASGAVDPDYAISYDPATLTVTPALLDVVAQDQSKIYGAALPSLTASYTGLVNGDTSASLANLPTLATTATAASHVTGSPYLITASGAVDPDYAITYLPGGLTVTPAPLTIAASDQSKVYGAALPGLTASFAGFVNGDTTASLAAAPTLATTATAASHVAIGGYAITASGAVDPDYAISYDPATLTVTPAPLDVVAQDQSKIYGAALPGLTASYTGFVNGDTSASLATRPTLATTATAASHVTGSPYLITASGAVDPDYAITYLPGGLTVTPAPLTIAANGQSKVYGAALPTLTASYIGLVNGDTAASLTARPTLATTATASSHVAGGPYAITASGAADPDYAITYTAGTLAVTPTPLTIKANDQAKVYGAALPGLTASFAGLVNGDTSASLATRPTLTTAATAASHVAASPYAITASGASDSDYAISYVGGGLTITPAPLTVAAGNLSKVYGAAVPTLVGTISGVLPGDQVAARYATTATAASGVAPGGYAITVLGLTGASAGDYRVATSTPATLTVTPAPLTIAAVDASKVYGQANPGFGVSYSGFVLGQGSAALSGSLGFATSATASSHVGSYAVTPSGLAATDYAIQYLAGRLAVTPAPLTVSAPLIVIPYGNSTGTLAASYSGFVNGDTAASLATLPTLTTGETPASHFGVYPVAISGGSDPDYTITDAPGAIAVTKTLLTITPDDDLTPFGVALPGLTAHYSGFVNGDTAASLSAPVSLSTAATAGSPVGVYPIVATGASSSDYAIQYGPGAVAITPNPAALAFVTSLYRTILQRTPDAAGLTGWLTAIAYGMAPQDVAAGIYDSPEAVTLRAHAKTKPLAEAAAYRLALAAIATAV